MEMKLSKAENIMEHSAEINARPPRTWFQTESQKRDSSNRKAPTDTGLPPLGRGTLAEKLGARPKRTPLSGLSRKQKRRREDLEDAGALKKDQASQKKSARKVKSASRVVNAPATASNASMKKSRSKKH